jgi:hypothetical protein
MWRAKAYYTHGIAFNSTRVCFIASLRVSGGDTSYGAAPNADWVASITTVEIKARLNYHG